MVEKAGGLLIKYHKIARISLQVGNSLNWCLLGVLTIRVYLYYLSFPKDKRWNKVAVYAMYCIELIQTAIVMVNITVMDPNVDFPTTLVVPVAGGLAALIAQCLYANRLQILIGSRLLSWSIRVISVLQFLCSIIFTLCLGFIGKFLPSKIFAILFRTDKDIPTSGYVWAGLSAICDVSICIAMTYSLLKGRNVIISHTRRRVVKLVRLVVEAGTITVLVNISVIALLSTSRSTGSSHIVPMILISKIYANSVLVLFNNRKIHGENDNRISVVVVPNTLQFAARTAASSACSEDLVSHGPRHQPCRNGCEVEKPLPVLPPV
ncbi:hypothetical protein AMATHDRAFT_66184 [Amanita thiersii Skay4041]|uniref:DUF6534 domain-containing protein n=1 Tax=Amanita thiersii Skay4041 TaxID=703135 RepID=A0A2A9NIR8_9AGAR|nr:hypothetical protein AMATHDRAFT_66184 [Amanita thiersii Skay4041]